MKSGLCGSSQDRLLLILMVDGLVFGWTPTAQRGVEATVVPPVDPFQGGEFDLLDAREAARLLVEAVPNYQCE